MVEINESDIGRFYEWFTHTMPSEVIVFDNVKYPQGHVEWAKNKQEFIDKCKEFNKNQQIDVYIGGRDRKNTGNDNIISSDFIFLEIDEHDAEKPEELPKVRAFLDKNGIKPGLIGFSGGGYHIYIPMPKVIFNNSKERDEYKYSLNLFKKILMKEKIDIDPKVFDLQRVSRVLGSFNWKRGKISKIIEINDVNRAENYQNLVKMVQNNPEFIENKIDSNALEILERHNINKTDKWLYDILKSGQVIKADTGGNSVVFKNAAIILVREELNNDEIRVVGRALADLCEGRTLIAFMGWINKAKTNQLAEVNATEISNFIKQGGYDLEEYTNEQKKSQEKTQLDVLTYSDLKKFKANKNFIVDSFLYPGTVTMLYAPPAQFKSLISTGLGFAIANGVDFMGMKTKKSPTLYLDGENSQGIMKERAEQIHKGLRLKKNKFPLYFLQGGLLMDSKKNINLLYLAQIEEIIKKNKIKVLFFDTLHRFCLYDENSSDDLNKLYTQVFKPLADELKIAVVFLHHSTKSGGYRGSGDFLGMVDVSYRVERKAKTGEFKIINEKCRSGEVPEISGEIVFGEDYIRFNRLNETTDKAEIVNKLISVTQRVEELFDSKSKLSRKDIISFLEMEKFDFGSTKSVDRALKFLVEQRKVLIKSEHGAYSLA